MRTNSVSTEAEIQKACLGWLNLQLGCKVWRRNIGAFTGEHKGRKRFLRFGKPGQADITGLVNGRRIEIEVKRPGCKPSLEQQLWLREMQWFGAIAFWCDSLDDCMEQWRGFRVGASITLDSR